MTRLISIAEYLMGRDKGYASEYTEVVAQNAVHTVAVVNHFLEMEEIEGHVTSGWRPPSLNAHTPGAAKLSKHMLGLSVDLADKGGRIDHLFDCNERLLEAYGLWREDSYHTPGWCHLQIVPYGSWVEGKSRTFLP